MTTDASMPAAAARSAWIRGPAWDTLVMHSALWLVPAVLLLGWGDPDAASGPLDTLYLGLTALFWIGHRVGSTWLAYFTSAYRPLLRSEPVRFVVLPALVVATCFALLLPADEALPWTRAERVIGLAILDYGFVTYHFAAQHFGALSLYRVRTGAGGNDPRRRLDRIYALGIGGVLVFFTEILAGTVAFQHLWVDPWLDPDTVIEAQTTLRTWGSAILALVTFAWLVVELRTRRAALPRMLYVGGLAAMVAVALYATTPFLFLVVWTGQHWILATGLTAQVARAEPDPGASRWLRLWHGINARPWALVLVLVALSIALLPVMEVEAVDGDGGTFYGDRFFGELGVALRTSSFVPALVALGFATAFLHYLLDRAVYRLSAPQVRSAARGLLQP